MANVPTGEVGGGFRKKVGKKCPIKLEGKTIKAVRALGVRHLIKGWTGQDFPTTAKGRGEPSLWGQVRTSNLGADRIDPREMRKIPNRLPGWVVARRKKLPTGARSSG